MAPLLPSSLTLSIVLLLLVSAAPFVRSADEDPLQDFCVADLSMQLTINGFPCKPPALVQSTDFASPLLRNPANFTAVGSAVNLASVSTFAALNTQGLSIARIDFRPKGLNPPHVHPRATEVLFLAKGTLVVGFVSTAPGNMLFQQTLYEGDLFVFPRGLIHFQLNPDTRQPALAISALNSQNPGVSLVAAALFAAQPPLPEEVLEIALGIDEQEVQHLIASVATTLR